MDNWAMQASTQRDAPPAWSCDRRMWYRIPLRNLGFVAVLRAETDPLTALVGRLVNISSGGCCLVADAATAAGVDLGGRWTVTLPVGEHGLRQPATVAAVETHRDAPEDVLLRLHFEPTNARTQQDLMRWLSGLAAQTK